MSHIVNQIERRFPQQARTITPILLLLSALALLAGLALPALAATDPAAVATRLLDQFDRGEYKAAEASFTKEMATAVPAAKIKTIWETLPTQAGPANGRGTPVIEGANGMTVVTIPLHYENAELLAKIAVNEQGKIAGLFIQPAPAPPPAAPSADASFIERNIKVGQGERSLPGTLAMPASASTTSPVPGIVLVHGSGPNDRNETIGPNRPFLDIARELAAQGIAVLRYDKRNFARPQDFADGDYDIDEVVTKDAVHAVSALRHVAGVDQEKIYVLGHSLGAMLAPRIAERADDVAGLVLIAAPSRPILDILLEQHQRLAAMDGDTSETEKAAIAKLIEQIAQVRTHETVSRTESPMGLPAAYWRSVEAVKPIADAEALDLPTFLAQGGRDIQVVDADWQRWKSAFGDDPLVTFKFYPSLNHLGIAGTGPGSLAEYMKPGTVDETLISDIAAWIKAQH